MNTKMPDDFLDESADHIIELFSDVLELYYLSSMMRYIRNNILETKNHSEVTEEDPPL